MPAWTFIRHGQSQANAEGWFAGQKDSPLTPRGVEQALALRSHVSVLTFRRVFASDLTRALRTAELVTEGRGLPVVTTARLRERSCGAWERESIASLEARGEGAVLEDWNGRPPGGESLRDTALRVLAWLADVDADADTLVVSHGAIMRAVLGVLDGLPREEIGLWKPGNGEVLSRVVEVGTWARLHADVEADRLP